MNKKRLILLGIMVLLSGCVGIEDKSGQDNPDRVRLSGDVTVSSVDRKGF